METSENATATFFLTSPPRSLQIFGGVVTILTIVVGIVGNVLTVLATYKCPRLQNVAGVFILSLCITDMVLCVVVLPLHASQYFVDKIFDGKTLCVIVPFLTYVVIGVSMLSMSMVTINRYVTIVHQHLSARVYQAHWIVVMIVFCWVVSFTMLSPTLLGVWGKFGYDTRIGRCNIIEDANGHSSKIFSYVFAFVVTCIIISYSYSCIFVVIHKSAKRLRRHSMSTCKTEQEILKKKRREWRMTKMVLATFIAFLACYLPHTIIVVIDNQHNSIVSHVIGDLLFNLPACINPIIYAIMNKQYRQAYRAVLCKPRQVVWYVTTS